MNTLKLTQRIFRTIQMQTAQKCARTLFTSETLDITQYQQNRQNAFENVEQPHRFKWELQCYLENEAEKEALHLKNAIEVLAHLIQSDMNDVELIRKTLYTYGSLSDVNEKAKRSMGNLTMSAIHSVNMADVGLQLYTDDKLHEFFAGFKCTILCLDLLYQNGQYNEILQIDSEKREKLWSKRTNFTKFIDTLVFGASYKLNTPDSLKYARQLWSAVGQASQFKRSAAFVAALSLNQGQPATVIQILQSLDSDYFVTEQIKLVALAELSYVNETIEALTKWTAYERLQKHKISKDVIERIRQRFETNLPANAIQKFQAIYNELISNDRITDETLEEILDRPVSSRVGFRGKRAVHDTESTYSKIKPQW